MPDRHVIELEPEVREWLDTLALKDYAMLDLGDTGIAVTTDGAGSSLYRPPPAYSYSARGLGSHGTMRVRDLMDGPVSHRGAAGSGSLGWSFVFMQWLEHVQGAVSAG